MITYIFCSFSLSLSPVSSLPAVFTPTHIRSHTHIHSHTCSLAHTVGPPFLSLSLTHTQIKREKHQQVSFPFRE